jgi:hypothetical protein
VNWGCENGIKENKKKRDVRVGKEVRSQNSGREGHE